MNDLSVSINPAHYALLVLVLNGLGSALKAIPAIKNELIPVLLAGFGGLAHGFLEGWTPVGILVGVAAGFSAVGGHQLLKSMKPEQTPPQVPPVVALALCVALSVTGCASKPATVAFKSTAAMQATVKTTMDAWYDYVVKTKADLKKLPAAESMGPASELLKNEGKVMNALERYKQAAAAAQIAVNAAYASQTDPPSSVIADAAVNLITLVNSLVSKP